MFFKRQQQKPTTLQDIDEARAFYASKCAYINDMAELPDEERNFLKEIARAELLEKAIRYTKT